MLQSCICTLELYAIFGSCHLFPEQLGILGFIYYFFCCLRKYVHPSHTFFLLKLLKFRIYKNKKNVIARLSWFTHCIQQRLFSRKEGPWMSFFVCFFFFRRLKLHSLHLVSLKWNFIICNSKGEADDLANDFPIWLPDSISNY